MYIFPCWVFWASGIFPSAMGLLLLLETTLADKLMRLWLRGLFS